MGKTRVLFILSTMDIGGVQSGVMNFVKLVPRETCHIDVFIISKKIGFHEKEFSNYGKIYHCPLLMCKTKLLMPITILLNNVLLKRKLYSFLKIHKYEVVHSKLLTYSAAVAEAAERANVRIRVVQSHVDKPDSLNPFHKWYYKWCADRIERSATCKLAVSPKAADLMFGKYGGKVIKNPTISLSRLDPLKYHYLSDINVIKLIQVGTFSHRKNQVFSMHIVKELNRLGYRVCLTFIGYTFDDPDYINEMKRCEKDLKLEKDIRYLPKDSDIPYELSQSDYMLIPSLREGLPNVALEAQAMGVPCFISDTVNQETDCGLCSFLSLEDGPLSWADSIVKYREKYGIEKRYIDMTEWDNTNVIKQYLKIWEVEGYR